MTAATKTALLEHQRAVARLADPMPLAAHERAWILNAWRADSTGRHDVDGAYFTPPQLAYDVARLARRPRILDLCAGTGRLAHACLTSWRRPGFPTLTGPSEIVCIEQSPAYVDVGRRVVPEATWICGDVFDLPSMDLGHFDVVISNPPFGKLRRTGSSRRYRGSNFAWHVVDLAFGIAPYGVFIVPHTSSKLTECSEACCSSRDDWSDAERYRDTNQVPLEAVDNAHTDPKLWQRAAPRTEVVMVSFDLAGAY